MTAIHGPLRYHGPPALCRVCGTVLNRALVTAGYGSHPCCDPDDRPWAWRDAGDGHTVVPLAPYRAKREQKFRRPSELAAERAAARNERESS